MVNWPGQGQQKALAEDSSWCTLEIDTLGGQPKEGGSIHVCLGQRHVTFIDCLASESPSSPSNSCFCYYCELLRGGEGG